MRDYGKDYSKVFENIKKKANSGFAKDTRIYVPKLVDDKAIATFRFLDAPSTDIPFVAKKYHYWNKTEYLCPKTFDKPCPICELNLKYNMNKDLAYIRALKTPQQSCYYVNIAVVSDKNVPENVGKNFIFKFGNPIYKKLEEVLNDGYIPWDEKYGINFKLDVIVVDKQNNYGSSRSDSIDNKYIETSLSQAFKNSEEVVNSIKKGTFDLSDIIKEDSLLSYKELEQILQDRVNEYDEFGNPKSQVQSKTYVTKMPQQDKGKKSMVDDDNSSAFGNDDEDFPSIKK